MTPLFAPRHIALAALIGAGLFAVAWGTYGVASDSAQEEPVRVRWLMAHAPLELYGRALKVFEETFENESGRRLVLEVILPQDLGLSEGDVLYDEVKRRMEASEVDISSTLMSALAIEYPPLEVIDLPFLFTDYDHVARVFDGPIGETLLQNVSTHSTVRGLGFALSGGWRIFISDTTAIHTPRDLKGKSVSSPGGGRIVKETLTTFGAVPLAAAADAQPEVIETPYTRYPSIVDEPRNPRYVSETEHSLLSTMVIARAGFFDALTERERTALKRAVQAATAVEREDSVALASTTRARLVERGSIIIRPTSEEKRQWMEQARKVYSLFDGEAAELIRAIEANR
ncbi:TRAP transporter substrate-binding protein DctP [Candidatus Kaiserbacteria bacterium]|nr:TRAP transporter substrate-binding protein DctP [Candidatus Kaiserbacteria bacterium]